MRFALTPFTRPTLPSTFRTYYNHKFLVLLTTMLRRTRLFYLISLRDITERMDGFERELIELKAFRKAVETSSPEVAAKAHEFFKQTPLHAKTAAATMENPLTADEFVELNQFYAAQQTRGMPVQNLLHINTPNDLHEHATLIYREYLVRVALRARCLALAPFGLSQMPAIKELKRFYQWTFHDLRNTKVPTDNTEAREFDTVIRRIFLRHYNVSTLLNDGFLELAKREHWKDFTEEFRADYAGLEDFFTEFCTSRVRLRLLIGNYVYLSTKILDVKPAEYESYDTDLCTKPMFFDHNPDDFVGQICKETSLLTLLKYSVREAQKSFTDAEIELNLSGEDSLTFVGVPYITSDIITAMLEDAVQANVQRQEKFGIPCTKITITLSQHSTNENYAIRISDTAGGVPLSTSAQELSCWSMYSHGAVAEHADFSGWSDSPIRLPYAHSAAHAMGGNITTASIEGFGTDRQLYVPSQGIGGLSI